MTYIGINGPYGAGKSTIYSKLTEREKLFGAKYKDVVYRIFSEEIGFNRRTLYHMIPSILQSFFLFRPYNYRLEDKALTQFLLEYPKFSKILSKKKERDSLAYEPIKHRAITYQLSRTAKRKDEHLILDSMFGANRYALIDISLEVYFESVPIPEIVIHIDAPSKLCIARQQKRGHVANKKLEKQERIRNRCLKVSKFLESNYNTKVIYVENTGTVDEAVFKIEEELKKFIDL